MLVKIRKKKTDPHPEWRVFEWNPGNGKWYPITRKGIYFSYNGGQPTQLFSFRDHGVKASELNAKIRIIMNSLLNGQTVTVNACYDRNEKKLVIRLREAA